MSESKEQKAKPLPERIGEDRHTFRWGVKTGTINLYDSFTLDGTRYSLFDNVYVWSNNDQPEIGKLVRIMETENHEKKVEILWFFRPTDIVDFLGNVRPLTKEVFLACGEGKGLSNVCPLEAVSGICNVVCSSKDQRNPQPTEKQLEGANYIFHRAFDVGMQKVLEEFPTSIAGIEVNHFFNRSCVASIVGSEPKAHPRTISEKGDCRFDVQGSTSSGGQLKSSIKDQSRAGSNINKSVHFLQASTSDKDITKKIKLQSSSGNQRDYALPKPSTKASGEVKHAKASCTENADLSTRKNFLLKKSEFTGKGPDTKKQVGTGICHKYSEVTRRSCPDASKWLKLEVWEEGRLNEANEKGTLVILENLDPSFAASEVEDIVWHVFRENVKVKMIQSTAFSSPLSGQALVLFKTSEAADKAISELVSGSLVLGDGRPIVGRRKLLRKVGAADKFVGHLKIDRFKTHRQREELRNAVSTSHFAQGNTIEFEMALQWRELQEKSNIWWKALLDGQAKEMEALMKQMKN